MDVIPHEVLLAVDPAELEVLLTGEEQVAVVALLVVVEVVVVVVVV